MDITILSFFHILFINTVFIIVDFFILKKIAKTKVYFLPVVIAGLTSLFLGIYLTNLIVDHYFHGQWFGFSRGIVKRQTFLIGALIFIGCTIIIELPFFIGATSNKKIGPALKTAVISNIVTNLPIGLLYLAGNMYYSHDD